MLVEVAHQCINEESNSRHFEELFGCCANHASVPTGGILPSNVGSQALDSDGTEDENDARGDEQYT
ncbi:MAG: hypothetical protein ABS34_10785 [Opitutaceae bacterium BACL24 MAG-120322-bin51]|nr:MAG: hypothetical protein ABS34_10785 [Opitutaceae bacterium BACL24 MAG-120322-bin51]